ncbi:MAG TPA: helix-turn-helix transcriptional regulator [Candidatus Acidoferrales bacterium]|jgi:XRE family aerobic/anaerobic benzoate catabolism transcriptional regulator|nr:helix-turn-helix transcriptional regulator [Candidatus Acidoferrales bacterium]
MAAAHTSQNFALGSNRGFVSENAFLSWVGNRIREARARRGMTRKLLAAEADVSERHLAQLESGEGNISIVLLRRIAAALNVSLSDLFMIESERSPEETAGDAANGEASATIARILRRMPSAKREQVAARLLREFAGESTVRRGRIALIGLRGAGKSTLGSKLAKEMKVPFVELDHEIEKDARMPLEEIFSLYGQSGYRRIEKRALDRVIREKERAVISVGGGVVSEKETYDALLTNCFAVWVKAQPEEHMSRVVAQGDLRAMADNDEAMEDLRRILDAREPFYRKADMHLDTSGRTVEQSFRELKKSLHLKNK